jgi:hypothetical protein
MLISHLITLLSLAPYAVFIIRDIVERLKDNPDHYGGDAGNVNLQQDKSNKAKARSCCWLGLGIADLLDTSTCVTFVLNWDRYLSHSTYDDDSDDDDDEVELFTQWVMITSLNILFCSSETQNEPCTLPLSLSLPPCPLTLTGQGMTLNCYYFMPKQSQSQLFIPYNHLLLRSIK